MGVMQSYTQPPPLVEVLQQLLLALPAAARVCPTKNASTDWTKDEIPPRHWFTRTGLTNGRHAKRHATLPTARQARGAAPHLWRGIDPQTRTPIGRRLRRRNTRNTAAPLVHAYTADQWASCKATHNPTDEARLCETAFNASSFSSRGVAVQQVETHLKANFETVFSLDKAQGLKPGAFEVRCKSNSLRPTVG
jgi:hypothetical protein